MKIIAHRGFSELYTENTFLAFTKAIESGADGIETDIRLSLDGHAILFHDRSLKRLANLDKEPRELKLEELQEISLANDQYIPSLDELLELCEDKISLVLEIKYHLKTYKKLIQIINLLIKDKLHWIEVSCFEDTVLEELHKLNKDIKLHKLIEDADIIEDEYFHKKYAYISCFDINVKLARLALRKGLIKDKKVIFWTVDDEDISQEIKEGLYAVMTNNPQKLKEKYD